MKLNTFFPLSVHSFDVCLVHKLYRWEYNSATIFTGWWTFSVDFSIIFALFPSFTHTHTLAEINYCEHPQTFKWIHKLMINYRQSKNCKRMILLLHAHNFFFFFSELMCNLEIIRKENLFWRWHVEWGGRWSCS